MKFSRKFKTEDYYSNYSNQYYLLPFRFHSINSKQEVIVNEVGDYLVVDTGTANSIVNREINPTNSLYPDLIANYFISETPIPDTIDVLANKYRTKKSFLEDFTSLHIFVVTLRCDHTCHYCQVSRVTENKSKYDISIEDLNIAIDFMFKAKTDNLTMEFQGGEPLLAFDKVKYGVNRAKELNKSFKKNINFVICTNLVSINEEILYYCKENGILISTSYDGPKDVHDKNRPYSKGSSHESVLKGLELTRKILGNDQISALMTTTNLTLEYPIEIIDDYVAMGFKNIFLRPISPYGFAVKSPKKNKYDTEKYLEFYKKGLLHIIELNKKGVRISEDYATIILKKILTPFSVNYVDLQSPSGSINSAIVYNYDGAVYASDESRMLAEMGDNRFKLGELSNNTYDEIFYSDNAIKITECGINESLPGCSECGFQQFCGADPIYHYATQGDLVGYRPESGFCTKNMAIINFLFNLLSEDSRNESLFRSWINKTHYNYNKYEEDKHSLLECTV